MTAALFAAAMGLVSCEKKQTLKLYSWTYYTPTDVVKAFEKASGREIKYKIAPRRAGDIAQCYADPAKANNELGWKAEFGIEDMCRDSWNWQSKNPNGYPEK